MSADNLPRPEPASDEFVGTFMLPFHDDEHSDPEPLLDALESLAREGIGGPPSPAETLGIVRIAQAYKAERDALEEKLAAVRAYCEQVIAAQIPGCRGAKELVDAMGVIRGLLDGDGEDAS